ncbi:MAG: polyprenol monophosphomannose synthase [Actinomycetota bacterium]
MKGLVILPTFNEAGTIAEVIDRVLASTPDVDVLVVDDASPDGTGEIADRIAAGESRVGVLHRPAKGGLGPAYLAGFRHGLARGYDAFIEMDSDLSHDPADVARLLAGAADADLVIGSRYVPGGATVNWSPFRKRLSRAGTRYAKTMLGLPLSDATSGFRCYRRALLEALPLEEIRSEGYAFQIELAWRTWTMGFRLQELPIVFTERREGASKMSRAIVVEALWRVTIWAARRKRPPNVPHPASIRSRP